MFKTKGDKVFDLVNYSLLSLVFIIVLYPLIFTVVASLSDPKLVIAGGIWLFPRGVTLNAYKNVFINNEIWIGYENTILYTVAGTAINIFVTITCAFALSRKSLIGRNLIMGIFVFTMYFSGGMIPTYMLINNLGMINTRWAMIIPTALSVYYLIITRTFYQNSIPEEIYESSKIDGCSDIRMFMTIAIPLSAPIIAVMTLFYGVFHWNQFFNALIYLNDTKLYPLQLVLRNILIMNQQMITDFVMNDKELEFMAKKAYMAETMKYALIFISSFPILMVFPLIQRFFVQGVMIGAIKG